MGAQRRNNTSHNSNKSKPVVDTPSVVPAGPTLSDVGEASKDAPSWMVGLAILYAVLMLLYWTGDADEGLDNPIIDLSKAEASVPSVYAFNGLDDFSGKAVLIFNVASQCGYTVAKYAGIAELLKKYTREQLEIIAFPCNQFGEQEPGPASEVAIFAATEMAVPELKVMDKIDVNGADTAPIYRFLKGDGVDGYEFGGDVKWNFESFLVSPEGQVVHRFLVDDDIVSTEAIEIFDNAVPK